MIYDRRKLRGRIIEKYGSQSKFAEAINSSNVMVSGKLTGIRSMTYDDVSKWARALDISTSDIGIYFFYEKS